jgi:FkbM family methyltransferase
MNSQYGEDNFILEFFGDKLGFLCDIGAADGLRYSNSRTLLSMGWEGLLIEPNKNSFAKLVELYSGNKSIHLLNACCYKEDKGEIDFFCDTYDGFGQISTMSDEFRQRCEEMYSPKYVAQKIRCMRTTDALLLFGITKIDFLSIDCEGVDLEVLQGIDMSKFDIKLICIEHRDPNIFSVMSDCGYARVHHTEGNDFYAK